ncbi:MAG: hypothetical protein EON95_07925 [Caulobacteraceae bacterium]|nr:MAG: hypothetical protein EON95_07925 [Caulobacteraceae bacterium]
MGRTFAVCLAVLILALAVGPAAAGVRALDPQTEIGLQLRRRHGVDIPSAATVVYVYSAAAHHTLAEQSAVAWRDAEGRWTVSTFSREGPALLDIPVTVTPETSRRLTAAEGRALDRLLRRPATYRQTFDPPRDVGVGAVSHTMEIVSPQGRMVVAWTGLLRGPAGEVANLVIGKA